MKTKLRKCIRRIIAFVSVFVMFSAMSLNAFAADFIAGADYNGVGVHQDSELKSQDFIWSKWLTVCNKPFLVL